MKERLTMKTAAILTGLSLLALSACNKAPEATQAPTALPFPTGTGSAQNWTETVSKTADGGMLMGNPNAPVKLIEYGALSCSHCAEFSEQSKDALKVYIAKGSVSYEFRNFLLNILDVPASLLARCGGPGPSFAISEQMYAAQREWAGKASTITAAEQQSWANLPPEQLAPMLAAKLGLDSFVQARGVGAEKAKACLTDKAAVDELTNISKVGTETFNITGTPTFIINNSVVPNVTTWSGLEPELKKAGA
jgi:protein-disulfide isomerase